MSPRQSSGSRPKVARVAGWAVRAPVCAASSMRCALAGPAARAVVELFGVLVLVSWLLVVERPRRQLFFLVLVFVFVFVLILVFVAFFFLALAQILLRPRAVVLVPVLVSGALVFVGAVFELL